MTPEKNNPDSDEEKSVCCCHSGGCKMRKDLTPPATDEKSASEGDTGEALYMVPTDHGWAWVICAGCFTMTFIMSLYDQVLAVMFVDIVDKFEVSSTTAALVFTIHAFTFSAGSIISSNIIVPAFDDRTVIVSAAVVNSLSTIIIAFSPNIAFYLVFHLFKGLSIGSMWVPALGLLGHYFRRRRSLASTITNAGIGVSLLLTPPFVRDLFDNFGFRGTLLIISGIEMQAIAMGLLLRPPSFYPRNPINTPLHSRPLPDRINQKELCFLLEKRESQYDLDTSKDLTHMATSDEQRQSSHDTHTLNKPGNGSLVSQFENHINQDCKSSHNNLHIYVPTSDIDTLSTETFKEEILIPATCEKLSSETEQKSLLLKNFHSKYVDCSEITTCDCNNSLGNNPVCNALVIGKGQREMTETPSLQHKDRVTCWRSPCEALSRIFDFRLLNDWLMRLLLASTVFGALLVYIPTYIPTLAVQKGVAKPSAAILLTVCGGVNLLSSLLQGIVIDCKIITASKFIVLAQFIVGTMCHLTYFFTSFPTLLLLSIAHGMFGGARMSLMPVVAMDFVGVANLSKALGFNAMVATLSLSLHHPFLGYLLEVTKGFTVPFHYVGFALYISAGLMLLETCGRTRKTTQENLGKL